MAIAVSMLVAFALTWLFYSETAEGNEKVKTKNPKSWHFNHSPLQAALAGESFDTPVPGEIKALHEGSDELFSSGAMGQGVIVLPQKGEVFAPFDGEVVTIFPTGHAIGIRSNNGAELLIHIGMNTVELGGKHYETFVQSGDQIHKGDLLIKFDREAIEAAGYVTETPVILTNSQDYSEVKTYLSHDDKIIETASQKAL